MSASAPTATPLKLTSLLFLFFGLSACKHEPLPTPSDPATLPDCRLLTSTPKDGFRKYVYEYDTAGHLAKRLELWNGALRQWYILRYSSDKLVARELWTAYPSQPVTMVAYDTLLYDTAGRVAARRTLQPGDNFSVNLIYDYTYDDAGFPVKSRTYHPASGKYRSSRKYFWNKGNIIKIEDFAGDFGQIEYEGFYEYNSGLNPERQASVFPEEPESQNKNLIKYMRVIDYTGLLDLICNPCKHEYKLNDQKLPTRIQYGWDAEEELVWECH